MCDVIAKKIRQKEPPPRKKKERDKLVARVNKLLNLAIVCVVCAGVSVYTLTSSVFGYFSHTTIGSIS